MILFYKACKPCINVKQGAFIDEFYLPAQIFEEKVLMLKSKIHKPCDNASMLICLIGLQYKC